MNLERETTPKQDTKSRNHKGLINLTIFKLNLQYNKGHFIEGQVFLPYSHRRTQMDDQYMKMLVAGKHKNTELPFNVSQQDKS